MTPSVGLPKGHLQCKMIFEDHDEERADRTEESYFRWMGENGKRNRETGFYIKKK